MERTAVDVLRDARALVAKGWTRKAIARTETGEEAASCGDINAVCWCIFGALYAQPSGVPRQKASRIIDDVCGGEMVSWNDAPGRTQAEVLAAFDRAIELAQPLPAPPEAR